MDCHGVIEIFLGGTHFQCDRKARFTEHQIIVVLKSVEARRTVKDVDCEAGIFEASYYNRKAKYGGMEAYDIKKLKDLEEGNRRLKQMFADLSPECRPLSLSRTMYFYKPDTQRDETVILTIT